MRRTILAIMLLTILPCYGFAQQPNPAVSMRPSAGLATARAMSDAIRVTLDILECRLDEAEPTEHTAWLESVANRLQSHLRERDSAFGVTAGVSEADMVSRMASMTTRFQALQNAILDEGSRFRTLSSNSKAEHDIYMNIIRNMKA